MSIPDRRRKADRVLAAPRESDFLSMLVLSARKLLRGQRMSSVIRIIHVGETQTTKSRLSQNANGARNPSRVPMPLSVTSSTAVVADSSGLVKNVCNHLPRLPAILHYYSVSTLSYILLLPFVVVFSLLSSVVLSFHIFPPLSSISYCNSSVLVESTCR